MGGETGSDILKGEEGRQRGTCADISNEGMVGVICPKQVENRVILGKRVRFE